MKDNDLKKVSGGTSNDKYRWYYRCKECDYKFSTKDWPHCPKCKRQDTLEKLDYREYKS